jgi:hypothetical protein
MSDVDEQRLVEAATEHDHAWRRVSQRQEGPLVRGEIVVYRCDLCEVTWSL